MEYNKLIAGMHTGDDVEGFYVLKDAFLKTTAAGKPFLSGVLADRSGTIDLKVWDYSGPIGANPADTGRIVKIRGQVSEFKGAPQLTAGRIRMADGNDQYDVSALVPVAPIDPDERLQEIRRLIDSMEDADYQSVARTMLERHLEAFRSIPAAKSVHHSFLSGLLMLHGGVFNIIDNVGAVKPADRRAELRKISHSLLLPFSDFFTVYHEKRRKTTENVAARAQARRFHDLFTHTGFLACGFSLYDCRRAKRLL